MRAALKLEVSAVSSISEMHLWRVVHKDSAWEVRCNEDKTACICS